MILYIVVWFIFGHILLYLFFTNPFTFVKIRQI